MGLTNHDANVVLMGATQSNHKQVDDMAGEVEAGVAVRRKSDGTLSTLKADGELLGISLGSSLSKNKRSAICRRGDAVPLKLTAAFEPVVGEVVHIHDATGLACDSAEVASTAVNAIYRTGKKVGKGEDGLNKDVALVDFPGGL